MGACVPVVYVLPFSNTGREKAGAPATTLVVSFLLGDPRDGMGAPGPCGRWQSADTSSQHQRVCFCSRQSSVCVLGTNGKLSPRDMGLLIRTEFVAGGSGPAVCYGGERTCLPLAYSEVTCAALTACQCCSESPRRVHCVTQSSEESC